MEGMLSQLGHFSIDKRIGRGGMAEVYLATDDNTGRECAIKVLHEHITGDDTFVQRFLHEIKANKIFQHENIVEVIDGGFADGRYYMAMEYIDGTSLDGVLRKTGALPLPIAVYVMNCALDGLAHAHKHSIVHRDLKPANIMVTSDGRIKLTDFGVAKVADFTQLTVEGQIIGTPAFMSPEQVKGEKIDTRSDLFSMGIIFYLLLLGHNPFKEDTVPSTVLKIMTYNPPPAYELDPTIPLDVERVFDRMLAKDVRERYSSARKCAEDLTEYIEREGFWCSRSGFQRFIEDPEGVRRKINGTQAQVFFEKGKEVYYIDRSKHGQALMEFYRALYLDPDHGEAIRYIERICERHSYNIEPVRNPEINALEEELADSPYDPDLLRALVKEHQQQNNLLEAVKYLRRLQKLAPDDDTIRSQLATLVGEDEVRSRTSVLKLDFRSVASTQITSGKAPSRNITRSKRVSQASRRKRAGATTEVLLKDQNLFQRLLGDQSRAIMAGSVTVVLLVVFAVMALRQSDSTVVQEDAPSELLSRLERAERGGSESFFRASDSMLSASGCADCEQIRARAEEAFNNRQFNTAKSLFNDYQNSLDSPSVYTKIRLAEVDMKLGQKDEAARKLEEITIEHSDAKEIALAYRLQAVLNLDRGDTSMALKAYRDAAQNVDRLGDPNLSGRILNQFGELLQKNNQEYEAVNVYNRVINSQAEVDISNQARLGLANIYRTQNNQPQAQMLYQFVVRTAPENSVPKEVASRALEELEREMAIQPTTPPEEGYAHGNVQVQDLDESGLSPY